MDSRSERLDPVRWRAPGRGGLWRLAVVAALLVIAAGAVWIRPAASPCITSAAPIVSSDPKPTTSGRPPIPEGTVGVPVRLADPTALALVRPGNLVDLLRLDDEGDSTPVASSVLVLDVTGADDPTIGGLLLALAPEQAGRAVGGPGRGFAILIRPG